MKSHCPKVKIIYFVFFFFGFLGVAKSSWAANGYVDNAATGSNNGTSWANAWTSFSSIKGLVAGDTVYISGGTTSKTYTFSSWWIPPKGGVQGNPVSYRVGQDAGHNGTVIFDGGGNATNWLTAMPDWVTIDGEYNGKRHILIQNYIPSSEYVTASYLGVTGFVLKGVTFQDGDAIHLGAGGAYIEMANCYMHATQDHAIYYGGGLGVTGWDTNKIHENTFILDGNAGGGSGCDGIQWGDSLSVYNNVFISNPVPNSIGQHQDGIQTSGQYTKVYNNVFRDIGNYAVYWNVTQDTSNVRIYNNVISISQPGYIGGYQAGIALGQYGSNTIHFSNIIVANNTVGNYGSGQRAVAMTPGTENPKNIWDSTSLFYNNLSFASGFTAAGWDNDPNISGYGDASNKVATGSNNSFVAYTPVGSGSLAFSYDFHLLSTDTLFKDQGVSMASYFTADHDGISRPQGSAWDIGAYEYVPGGDTTPPAAPTGLSVN